MMLEACQNLPPVWSVVREEVKGAVVEVQKCIGWRGKALLALLGSGLFLLGFWCGRFEFRNIRVKEVWKKHYLVEIKE